MKECSSKNHGFAMPIIIIVSTAMILTVLALLQTIGSLRTYTTDLYYNRLAEEAAEAGTIYAVACLEKNYRTQTWGNTPSNYLTQSSNCSGAQNSFPNNSVVAESNTLRSRFEVGNLDYSSYHSVQVSARGFVDLKIGDGTTIAKTYTSTVKRTVTWAQDFTGTRSVSGAYRTCAIMNGSVYCWGKNVVGQLGNGRSSTTEIYPDDSDPLVDSLVPVSVLREEGVLANKNVIDIAAGTHHTCALTDEGKVYCWGYNSEGQVGTGDTIKVQSKPVEVKGNLSGKFVTNIGTSGNTSCAIAEGKIYCWGEERWGVVGNGSNTWTHVVNPTLVKTGGSGGLPSNYTATKLSTSGGDWSRLMCAIVSGKAYCWGSNDMGQVGINSTTSIIPQPTAVYAASGILSGKTVTDISADGNWQAKSMHACAVASGKVYCWGSNSGNSSVYGALGNNSSAQSSRVPVAVNTSGVLSGKAIVSVTTGTYHSCAMTSDAKIACWGYNAWGQLGNNSTTNSRIPVWIYQNGEIAGETAVDLGGGVNRGCAVVASGKSFCWGRNFDGQIGDGTTVNRQVPTESLFLRPKNSEVMF